MIEEKFRNHPSIIIEKLGGVITFVFFIGITNIRDMGEWLADGMNLNIFLLIAVMIGLLSIGTIYNFFVWSKTFISMEENTIVVQRNTINSKVKTFGIKNISSVNLQQNIFEQIIGTYKIKIDTDSLSTADDTDIEIILSKEDAYKFKHNVMKLMNNEKLKYTDEDKTSLNDNVEEESYIDEDNIEFDIVYSNKDVLKHCFYNISVLGLIFNLAFLIATSTMEVETQKLVQLIATSVIFITVIVSIIKIFVGDLFKYYKFSIKRLEDELYISYGLLNQRKFTVPIDRINAVNIKQSMISRIFKRYHVEIVTIGVGDEESEGAQILLSSKKEELLKNMKILLPELNLDQNVSLKREPKKQFIIKLFNIVILFLAFASILYYIYTLETKVPSIFLLILGIAIPFIAIIMYYMSYVNRGIYLGKDSLIISEGVFQKEINIIKYKKIQYIDIKENPISSKLNLYKGRIYILADLANSTTSLGYYDSSIFEELKDKIIKI